MATDLFEKARIQAEIDSQLREKYQQTLTECQSFLFSSGKFTRNDQTELTQCLSWMLLLTTADVTPSVAAQIWARAKYPNQNSGV